MELQNLSFEKLPEAVTTLLNKVNRLEDLLTKKQEQTTPTEPKEKLLTVQEAAEFLSLSVPTMYSKVSKGELPFMKRSKRLYFSSLELMAYLKEGRKKSNSEIEQEAENYLSNNKKGLRYE